MRVFIDIATRGISTLSTKSIALLLNAIEAFSSDRKEYDKALQVRSSPMHLCNLCLRVFDGIRAGDTLKRERRICRRHRYGCRHWQRGSSYWCRCR